MLYKVTGTLVATDQHVTRNFYADSPEQARKLATEEGIAVDEVTLLSRPLHLPAPSEEQATSDKLQSVAVVLKWLGIVLIAWSLAEFVFGIVGRQSPSTIFTLFAEHFIAGLLSLLIALVLQALSLLVRNSERRTRPTPPQQSTPQD